MPTLMNLIGLQKSTMSDLTQQQVWLPSDRQHMATGQLTHAPMPLTL
jgi:hypothetical protein